MPLLQNTLEKCHKLLFECDVFDDFDRLRNVFISRELNMLIDRIKKADTKPELIEKNVAVLLEKKLSSGKIPLLVFLSTLISRARGEPLEQRLRDLYTEIQNEMVSQVVLPFVIVAMTGEQARSLFSEEVFSQFNISFAHKAQFQKFKEFMGISSRDFLSQYRETPELWRITDRGYQTPIQTIITNVVDEFNEANKDMPLIKPEFFSREFFSEKEEERFFAWDGLGWQGCILIVDAFSLFHPFLYQRLLESEMSANERTAVAITTLFPPTSPAPNITDVMSEIRRERMQRAYIRSDWRRDEFCNHDVNSLNELSRWIKYSAIKQITSTVIKQLNDNRPDPIHLAKMNELVNLNGYSSSTTVPGT